MVCDRTELARTGARAARRHGAGRTRLAAVRAEPRHGTRGRRDRALRGAQVRLHSATTRRATGPDTPARCRSGLLVWPADARVQHVRCTPVAALGAPRGTAASTQARAACGLSHARR